MNAKLTKGMKVNVFNKRESSVGVLQFNIQKNMWVKATILHQCSKLGVKQTFAASGVQACITKILAGEGLAPYNLALVSSFSLEDFKTKTFAMTANKVKGELTIVVNDVVAAANPKTLESIYNSNRSH